MNRPPLEMRSSVGKYGLDSLIQVLANQAATLTTNLGGAIAQYFDPQTLT
jgi:hypothetical protein